MQFNSSKMIVRKVISFCLRISNKLKLSYIPFLPVYLDIEPINSCNFGCEHCKVTFWGKDSESLTTSKFKKIINQFPNLHRIKLQGLGEPLLNKHFSEILRLSLDTKIKIHFYTNGSVYNKSVWDEINKSENIRVTFSIDAATKEKFENIRKGSNFGKVIKNIEKITKNNKHKYSFWTVVNKDNIDELSGIVQLAEKLLIKNVTFQTFLNDWQSPEVGEQIEKISFSPLSSSYIKNEHLAKKMANENDINLQIFKGNFLSKKNKCSWPFKSAFIASNGDVVPCCVIADSDVIKMGNIFEKPFKEIWNSNKYKNFRGTIRKHKLHDFCKNCYGEK